MAVSNLNFAVVILAAGRSSRMGRAKLLLPWASTSVLGHLFREWRELGASQNKIVVAPDSELQRELDRLAVPAPDRIINPDPERGMFSSIQCAARFPHWSPSVTHFILTLGDQPHVRRQTLQQLLDSIAQAPESIWQPAHNDRRRHPVALPRAAFDRLRDTKAGDLKGFLASIPETRSSVEIDDPGLDLDIDTPADYEAALKLAGLS